MLDRLVQAAVSRLSQCFVLDPVLKYRCYECNPNCDISYFNCLFVVYSVSILCLRMMKTWSSYSRKTSPRRSWNLNFAKKSQVCWLRGAS